MSDTEKYIVPTICDLLEEKGLDRYNEDLIDRIEQISSDQVERVLASGNGTYRFDKLLTLISPAAKDHLEQMAQLSRQLTIQRFGRTIKFYAPLYLSNYCVNSCVYCGFNCTGNFERTRLSIDEAFAEAKLVAKQGFKDILLVSGEDKKFITVDYLVELTKKLRKYFSSISIEIYQLEQADYKRLFQAGIDGVTIYQETYDRQKYKHYHPAGPKKDYKKRLRAADSICSAGMREVGLGSLLGLADWRLETLAMAEHGHYLMKRYWQSHISFSFPRIRQAYHVQNSLFDNIISDRELVQMILALRLCFADAGLVLSTRESSKLRDHIINLGITKVSAGSKTDPGGYSGNKHAAKQFEIEDNRMTGEVVEMVKHQGYQVVWKDWDHGFDGN